MTRKALLKLTATGLVALLGLSSQTAIVQASDGAVRENVAGAARSADRAQELMTKGRAQRAVSHAERAVELAPSNAAHRALLGQVYLSVGRFASAQSSFDAAAELGDGSSRTVIGRALAMIGNGHADQALGLIEANAQSLPASDYGLALALAGQPERGGLVLTDVVRAGNATARDRQNLALCYALAGRWLEARLIAAQDIGPVRVGARMEEWAAMLQTGDQRMRVASILGTTVADDPGMPVRLALNGADGDAARVQTLAMADDPAPLAQYAPPPPGAGAAVEMAQTDVMKADMTQADMAEDTMLEAVTPVADYVAEDAEPAPAMQSGPAQMVDVATNGAADAAPAPASSGLVFVSNPVIQPLRSVVASVAPLRRADPAPTSRRANRRTTVAQATATQSSVQALAMVESPRAAAAPRTTAPAGPVRTSGWAVQLGAYDSLTIASHAWSTLGRRHAMLGAHDGVSTAATVNGRRFYRLAATGFQSQSAARAACSAIVSAGGTCFVRQIATGEQVRWASREANRRIASR